MKNPSNIKFLYLFVLLFFTSSANSQIFKIPEYSIETGATLSKGTQTPFWLLSNQYGLITPDRFNGWIKLGFKTNLSAEKNFDYDYGLEVTDRLSNANTLYLQQAYLRLKFYFLNFQVGSLEETFGNQDSSLSSGGLLWSGNARPMPKVSLLVPEYTVIPFTKGYLEFKGGISHGWFEDNRYVKNAWLHHKYIYFQLGGKLPVHFHYGLHHFAQWGGNSTDSLVGKLPQSFNDFLRVFFVKAGDETAPYSDQIYVLGNHLGSRNFGLDLDFSRLKIGIYWQTIIEDKSGWYWGNNKDGLWGIYFHLRDRNHLINGVGYEFINTTDQSGLHVEYWLLNGTRYYTPVSGGVLHYAGGNDNYFNHGFYQFGWTYHRMTIGTPLITSPVVLNSSYPESEYMFNNKITGHHFSLEGKYKYLLYKLFLTYSLNFGTNSHPLDPALSQYSFLMNIQLVNKLPWGMNAGLSAGYDHGKLIGNNTGLMIIISKKGCLNGK